MDDDDRWREAVPGPVDPEKEAFPIETFENGPPVAVSINQKAPAGPETIPDRV